MNICFILVEPAVPGNIGASARAIKTMGFSQLRLVNPCDHLSTEAKMLAHASGEILENAEVFAGLSAALADLDLTIATTAKTRDARVEYLHNNSLPALIKAKGNSVENIGLVFGCEESGLSNDDIRKCDMVSSIPLKQDYPSLNLSQSVMIYAYTMADLPIAGKGGESHTSSPGEFRAMMNKTKETLQKLEIDRNPALYNRILERLALLKEDDIHLLLSVLGRLDHKI
ncbi:tRNA/rRNA methyltransferase [Bacteroidota bacterium]